MAAVFLEGHPMTSPNINSPCPFCGVGDDLLTPTGTPGTRAIYCIGCGAQGPTERTTALAWASWNERKVAQE
jgi:Lar family restriction alleviation protein